MLKKFNHINCANYKNFNWELKDLIIDKFRSSAK